MATPPQVRQPKRRIARVLLWLVLILAVAQLSLSAGLYWAMTRPPDVFGRIMARTPMPFMLVLPFETLWKHARRGHVNPGETVADFKLPLVDHSGMVQLSSFRGAQPVVLVFGSYT